MPECRRCHRVLPRSEVRATSLGFVCLEYGEIRKESRCAKIERELHAAARAAVREERAAA